MRQGEPANPLLQRTPSAPLSRQPSGHGSALDAVLGGEMPGWYRLQMDKVESLEREVEKLTDEELAAFRDWFAKFDADAWDRQMEADVKAGKLDRLATEALAEPAGQRTRPCASGLAADPPPVRRQSEG
jgi:hypothetical protein